MAGILVAYFSRTGRTRKAAEEIARQLGADVENITEVVDRVSGVRGYLLAAWQSLRKQSAEIRPPLRNPADYDLVILGTPVWASDMSSPMRAYIQPQAAQFRRIAVFCTLGGSGGARVLNRMAALCGKEPAGSLMILEREFGGNVWKEKVAHFANSLSGLAERRG